MEYRVRGRIVPGRGVGGKYVSHPYYQEWFTKLLGCQPYPGTLNLDTDTDWRQLAARCRPIVIPETTWNGVVLGAVYVWHARIDQVDAAAVIIRPLKSQHEPTVLEIVACTRVREHISGEEVTVTIECDYEPPYTKPPRLATEQPREP